MTSVEINEDIKRKNDFERLVTLSKVVIDQAKMGDCYLICFVKRELWEEFCGLVERIDRRELVEMGGEVEGDSSLRSE